MSCTALALRLAGTPSEWHFVSCQLVVAANKQLPPLISFVTHLQHICVQYVLYYYPLAFRLLFTMCALWLGTLLLLNCHLICKRDRVKLNVVIAAGGLASVHHKRGRMRAATTHHPLHNP